MEKRVVLTIVLSSLVLLVWSIFSPKPTQNSLGGAQFNQTTVLAPVPKLVEKETIEQAPEVLVEGVFSREKITFDEKTGSIKEVIFKDYPTSSFLLHKGLYLEGVKDFKKDKISADEAVFSYRDKDKEVIKKYIFSNSNYGIELEVSVRNLSTSPFILKLPLVLGVLDPVAGQAAAYQDFSVLTQEKLIHPGIHKEQSFNQLKFIGLRDRYFCAILGLPSEKYTGVIKKIDGKKSIIGLESGETVILPNEKSVQQFHIYLGPQDLKQINLVNSEWAAIIHYGTFDFISNLLLKLLEFFYGLVHNWGLAIIILSIAIYFLLYPLTLKQMRSMKEMQVLQPRIEQLRNEYKDNPQRLNKEILELYKEHKVNPLGGCLPLLLQMPIFFALYQALMRSVALKGAKFLWIRDLAQPDRLGLPVSLPFLGNTINILPILMMIGMFVQQKLSTVSTAGASNEQQKIMLIVFPLMFGVIFYGMPAGLVLYWLINSTLMLIYQIRISRSR